MLKHASTKPHTKAVQKTFLTALQVLADNSLHQGQANKLKDIAFREIAHLYTFAEAVPEDIRWLFQTPLELSKNACTGHSSASEHGSATGKTPSRRNVLHKWRWGN